jgi:hypothetical protein
MKMGARQRWIALIFLLMLALTAAAWVRDSDKESAAAVVEAPARSASAQPAAQPAKAAGERVALEKLRAHALDANNADPFAARSWRKAVLKRAPGPEAVVAPPAPTAPPLPYTYMGKLISEEDNAVFLTQGERSLVVHEGDVIDSMYRVDRFADSAVTLTHLPTGIQQTLVIGEAQ